MNRTLFHLTITLFMLASCVQKQEAMLSDTEGSRADSLALHVAVMPAMGCLPVYYACMTGLADSAGLEREQGYRYPHDFPGHWVEQQYLPDELKGVHYYRYGDNKTEQAAKRYWDELKKHSGKS